MKQIDLDQLTPHDIKLIFDALNKYFQKNGLALITDNIFLTPENLAKRWDLSMSCISNWRYTGGGPAYIKTGPGTKAKVRYPLFGDDGLLMYEQQRRYRSTSEETASITSGINQVNKRA